MVDHRPWIVPLIALTLVGCHSRELTAPAPLPSEPKEFVAVLREGQRAWQALQTDVQAGRFWMHWHRLGRRIAFEAQPISDYDHNPVLVHIWRTDVWCHVALSSDQLRQLRAIRGECTFTVIGDVQAINWYTKHVWLRGMLCEVDTCN